MLLNKLKGWWSTRIFLSRQLLGPKKSMNRLQGNLKSFYEVISEENKETSMSFDSQFNSEIYIRTSSLIIT